MSWQNTWKLVKSDYLKLVVILALAFYVAFIPHLRYYYAMHIDDWMHIAYSKAILHAGDVYFPDVFPDSSSGMGNLLEVGYNLMLGVFQRLSGISWMDISRYFPSIIFVITVLSVYMFAERMGFGWEAAFFTALIPTTVGILGPAFLVPVAIGLTFIPLLLWMVLSLRTMWSYLVLCIFIAFLMILHAPSALLMIMILGSYSLLGLRHDLKHSLWVIVAIVVPFLVTLPWTLSRILPQAMSLFVQKPLPAYVDLPSILRDYGYLPVIIGLLGTFVLVIRGSWKNYGLVTGLLVLLVMLSGFYTFHYGISLLYERGLLFAMLMMSIVAGAGLRELWKLELPWLNAIKLRKPRIIQATGTFLCLTVIGATLAVTIPDRQAIPYYYMIDKYDYEAFVWIRDNVDLNRQKAVLDPWKATAFTVLTEKSVYNRIFQVPTAASEEAYDFIRSGSANITFLLDNGISIIYTRVYEWKQGQNVEYGVVNPDFVEVRKDIYVLKEKGTQ